MRRAFTMTELLIGMLIVAITAGIFSLDVNSFGKQTAKHEAERVAAYIQTHLRRADITQDILWITITAENIKLKTGEMESRSDYDNAKLVDDPAFTTSDGCTFQNTGNFVYPKNADKVLSTLKFKFIPDGASVSIGTGTDGKYCLTLNGSDGSTYNVLIGSN